MYFNSGIMLKSTFWEDFLKSFKDNTRFVKLLPVSIFTKVGLQQKQRITAKSELQMTSPYLTELKRLYAVLLAMNYFKHYSPFPQTNCCKPLTTLLLFRWKIFRRDRFLGSTSSGLYSKNTPYHRQRIEVSLSFFTRTDTQWNKRPSGYFFDLYTLQVQDQLISPTYTHNLHLRPVKNLSQ